MAQRELSETGWYHITTRSAGQVALFEDDNDRRKYLSLLKTARNESGARVIAWVLMTNHVHLVVDFGEQAANISTFMHIIDSRYTRYFNKKTGRSGTLFQGNFWSKPILNDAQLMATVHYIHMNPERAGITGMREYRWSSYREYAGMHWVVDTSTILSMFGSFKAFDTYVGSPKDVVRKRSNRLLQDGDVLELAKQLTGLSTSDQLRQLPLEKRDPLIRALADHGANGRKIAHTLGIGVATVSRVLNSK